jgi:hypothetical protein
MSLKVLKATYYDGEEHVFHIAATSLVTYVQGLCNSLAAGKPTGSGSQPDPFRGMKSRGEWHTVIENLHATPVQYIKLANVEVTKSAMGYYMSATGIDTHGVRERGGPSYNEFRTLLKGMGKSDSEIASGVRGLLSSTIDKLVPQFAALAALTAAMFLAEPKRNARSFTINLMLLDMLQQGLVYGRKDRKLTWDNVLWRDSFGATGAAAEKTYDTSSGQQTLKPHERGGKLPMSHTGASEQSRGMPTPPVDNADVLFPNSELEKEGSLIVRWLQHYLGAQNKGFKNTNVVIPPGPTASFAERANPKTRPARYMVTFEGLQHGGGRNFTYLDIAKANRMNPFETVIADEIRNALKLRHSGFGMLALS